MRIVTLITACFIFLLAGCATTDSVKSRDGLDNRFKAIETKRDGKSELILVVVPSPDNALSSAMLLAAISAGAQNDTVEKLTALLQQGVANRHLAVTGDHDGITAATVESALNNLQGKRLSAKLLFVGDRSYGPALKKKAEALGLQFDVVQYPPAP